MMLQNNSPETSVSTKMNKKTDLDKVSFFITTLLMMNVYLKYLL